MLAKNEIKRIIEAALMAADAPLSIDYLRQLLGTDITSQELRNIINELKADYTGRGIELQEVASGYRFQVCPDLVPWINKLWEEKAPRYSRAMLETLALIAYKQPITRAEIEDVRGVAVSTNIMRTLMEYEWIRIVGHKEVPGRPALYTTTNKFLDYFNLKSIEELPILAELKA
jgi:segregation and condensation protein B